MNSPKLFMLLLGCKPPGRHVEQHDVFFGIANSLKDLAPEINDYWPQPGKIHVDAWREVKQVDGFQIKITPREDGTGIVNENAFKLFFINLGGYQENRFEEQHYVLLSARQTKEAAINDSKTTLFYRQNQFPGANSHIDDKYGIDVDDIYQIEEMLSPHQKEKYYIELIPDPLPAEDLIHLGYFKLNSLPD